MKNKLIGFFLLSFLFLCPLKVSAASISVAGTQASVVVGGSITVKVTLSESKGLGSWEFSIHYDHDLLQLTSGNAHVVEYVQGPGQNSKTYTYTFKAKKSGSAKISVINTSVAAWDETTSSPTDSTTIRCVSQEEIVASYSKNNDLKSLGVEGYELSFEKNNLNYSLEVENEVTSVNVQAEPEDAKARVSGVGEHEVHVGANTIEVVVTAENGATKTYTLQINVKELNPIEVTIGKSKYTVVRKLEELKDKLLEHFEQTTVKIGEEETLAFSNHTIDVTVVALKDEKGNISFYQYKDGKYEPYTQISSGNLTLRLAGGKKGIPKTYKTYKITVDKVKLTVYKIKKSSDFGLIYAQNVETGKSGVYVYDEVENTLQRYNTDEIEIFMGDLQRKTYIIVGTIGLIVILLIVLLVLLKRKRTVKKTKKLNDEGKEFLK